MKRFLPVALAVLCLVDNVRAAELLEPARQALEQLGFSGLIQRRVNHARTDHRLSYTEMRLDLRTGDFQTTSSMGAGEEHALKEGVIPTSGLTLTGGRWVTRDGNFIRTPAKDEWMAAIVTAVGNASVD